MELLSQAEQLPNRTVGSSQAKPRAKLEPAAREFRVSINVQGAFSGKLIHMVLTHHVFKPGGPIIRMQLHHAQRLQRHPDKV